MQAGRAPGAGGPGAGGAAGAAGDPAGLTVAGLRARLDAAGVAYPARAKKADLQALLRGGGGPAGAEGGGGGGGGGRGEGAARTGAEVAAAAVPGGHVREAARYAGLLAQEARLLALRVESGTAAGGAARSEVEPEGGPVFDHGLVVHLQEMEAALVSLEAGLRGPRWGTACTPAAEAGERDRHLEEERSWRRERQGIRDEVARLSGLYEDEVVVLKRALEIAKTGQRLTEQDCEALQLKLAAAGAASERAARDAVSHSQRAEAEAKSKRALAEALREALQRESAAQAEIEQLRLTQKYLEVRPGAPSPGGRRVPKEKLDLVRTIEALQGENAELRVSLGLREARSAQPPAQCPAARGPAEPIPAC